MRRPSAPLVISVIALFAALGGTSYAAAKITGKEIAKKTIKGGNVATKTLSGKKMKLNTLGGNQINEAKLGPVPTADTLDGIDSAGFMKTTTRLFEVTRNDVGNFANGDVIAQLGGVPAGSYLVSAKFTYDNDGAAGELETCTLEVPGTNDETVLRPVDTHMVTLQKAVTAGAPFDASVSCTGDGDDDALGVISIVATRLD